MTWPTTPIGTTNIDAGADSPATARADLKSALDALNQIMAHVSTYGATLLDDTTAADARTTLGATATGGALFTAATAAAARSTLGSTTVGDAVFVAATAAAARTALGFDGPIVPRGYIDGLVMSTAGSSTTMTIGAGHAADVDLGALISLDTAISKTTGSWTVGTGLGGLDTGTIANSTWYHFWLIRRPDTGVEDVLISLSATSPTMPANYTQKRRIGSAKTNGSGQWLRFFQDGSLFMWETPTLDIDVTGPGSSAVTRTLNVPTGVRVEVLFHYGAYDPGNSNQVTAYFSDLQTADLAASPTASPLSASGAQALNNNGGYGRVSVMTDTSARIRSRLSGNPSASATLVLKMATLGWRDPRGRDA